MLFGFDEDADGSTARMVQIRSMFNYDEGSGELTCLGNGRVFDGGKFRMASVAELRSDAIAKLDAVREAEPGFLSAKKEMVVVYGDVGEIMQSDNLQGALFQVASNANFLQFVDRMATAADGIEKYKLDKTQGTASSMAAAPGAIVRNYVWNLETEKVIPFIVHDPN